MVRKKIIELGKKPILDNGSAPFYYAAFIVSDLLDRSVNNERTSFYFPTNETEDEDSDDVLIHQKFHYQNTTSCNKYN